MLADDAWDVKSIHLFKYMADPHFAALLSAAALRRFQAQVILIEELQHPDSLHGVLVGTVEVIFCRDGKEPIIDVVRAVSTFVLRGVIGDVPFLASARELD